MKTILKIFLVLCLVSGALFAGEGFKSQRNITVDIFLDEEARELRTDDFYIKLVDQVSELFDKHFSITFSIRDVGQWISDNGYNTLNSLFHDFCRQNLGKDVDICLGFTAQKNLRGQTGISLFQEARILVRVPKNRDYLLKVLAHEFSHIFGAAHVDNPESLMDRFLKGNQFDDLNRKIITLHQHRKFKTLGYPLPSEWFKYLINLYQSITLANERLKTSKLPYYRKDQLRKQLLSEREVDSETLQIAFRRLEDVYIYQTFLFIEMKKYDHVLKTCKKILKINPRLSEAYNLMGIASRRKGDFDNAIHFYSRILKINPCYPKVNYNLGIALAKKGETDRAVLCYQRAIQCNDNFAAPWNNLGYIALERGNIDPAIKHFRRAISINPRHPLARANLAEALLKKKRIPEAMDEVKIALDLDSSFPGPHNVLGNIYSEMGDFERAEKSYQRAIVLQPSYFKAYFNLGNIYFKKKMYSQAIPFFQKSIKINPLFGNGYAGLGDCYLMQKKLLEAESEFKRAFETGYETAKLHLNLSYIHIRNQDFSRAVESSRRAIKLNPKLEMGYKNLAIAYFKQGNLFQAAKEFNRVLEINPGDGSTHCNLFVVCFLKKEYRKALDHMKMAEKMGMQVDQELKRELYKILNKNPGVN